MNWTADEWFARFHAPNLTEAFKAWWVEFYGTPEQYGPDPEEQHEYWVRCSFAWLGWRMKTLPAVTSLTIVSGNRSSMSEGPRVHTTPPLASLPVAGAVTATCPCCGTISGRCPNCGEKTT